MKVLLKMVLLKTLGIICAIYLVYGVSLFSLQRSVMFPRRHVPIPENAGAGIENLEKIWLHTSKGKVEAWYLPSTSAEEKSPAVIFAHGNGELIDYCADYFLQYNTMGIDVLHVEYPGYGRSEGRPSQRSITEAFVAGYDWLTENKTIDSDAIVAHGRSVGGGAACALAEERAVRALILESTFTDTKQFARGYLLPGFLVRDKFDNIKVIKSYEGPSLIMHGKYDEIIPYKNSVKLSKVAKNGTFISYNCRHNDCPPDMEQYWRDIKKFLEENAIIN